MPDSVSWLRLYHSFLDNKKTADLPPIKKGHWIVILLLASRNNPRGMIPTNKTLIKHLGPGISNNPDRLRELLDYFIRANLIDKHTDNTLWIHNFNNRQWLSNEEENPKSTDCSTVIPTDCCNELLIGFDDNKELMGNWDTLFKATETDKAFIGGFEGIFDHIRKLLEESISIVRSDIRKGDREEVDFILSGANGSKRTKELDYAFGLLTKLWNSLPGIVHHRLFNDEDRRYVGITIKRFPLEDIQKAIQRYSLWSNGAKTGRYRSAYSWTFLEFIRHNNGSLIQRLSADNWEDTCLPFDAKRSNKRIGAKDLLAIAEKKLGCAK